MKVAFRSDASRQIGTGHVMRCLTLADALAASGADCQFICRAHEGNLIDFIRGKGYVVHALPITHKASADSTAPGSDASTAVLAHSHWLDATQAQDAEACVRILAAQRPDWLIVDHYALDARWERTLAPHYQKLMAIDDLADRPHACDLLLDQTFGREATDYRSLVPAACHLLCGSQYALLRPEFAALRPYSLLRRARPALREVLITMGGVDKYDATGQVLQALSTSPPLPAECRITVVMGATGPWLTKVQSQAQDMPWPTRVLVGVSDMAQLMADSDLAIGAAGATSWERCCLGVPTIMLVLAENQRKVAQGLEQAGAAKLINLSHSAPTQISQALVALMGDAAQLLHMSECAASIVDGSGVNAVMLELEV
ncbi:UDP-2,4-diacetamido-2,4,6-trideoxy-beta-L-altropyranose hydrolase [Luteimonas sp. MC1782]|uniref:UDP-2,4-diacetamido-2,4, 6-trideoxy-beta-L-altropyranose hydrolase n=1 Tax=Luteimonas sp. MC1782 TaxID=2760305 RepID=UPI0016024BCE|nr:UDP-2,4-diacetamido-2,4,6-trideoxy-beta-L-altropyranose hydrolase [Luteimonas sp. MC1782]MBB1472237.1 UDP-2,4-diacetamido-2,4,6-trideoxy-beta-L-altropyranose hydrolase [Luteimonas sp. MC1782]